MQGSSLYGTKDSSYFSLVRHDVVDLVPTGTRSLLDVGCGAGDTALYAKRRLDIQEVVGIEYFQSAAKIAETRLDRVVAGDIDELSLDFPRDHFDCILCSDVLEHTKDPWHVLEYLGAFLQNDGVLIASIPNIRHIVPILKILFDRFDYEKSGILDRTHLHFFTLYTIRKMFARAGYEIEQIKTNRSVSWKFTLLNILSFGLMRPFSICQYILVARKKRASEDMAL
jgi:SAM-dependent methyltransferase